MKSGVVLIYPHFTTQMAGKLRGGWLSGLKIGLNAPYSVFFLDVHLR